MTRPMPGPPGGFTDRARLNYALLGKQITYEQYQEFGDALTRAFTARPKRLTAAECAAHYWQAFCYRARALAEIINLPPHEARRIVKESDTWHRFGTHHHALEES